MAPAPAIRWPPAARALAPLMALLLAGCTSPQPPSPKAANDTLRVVTTVLPVGLFTRAVAGDCARVEALLPAAADLHDLPVSPQLVVRLRGADVLVRNGLGLEAPLERLVVAAANPRLRQVEAAQGLPALTSRGHHHSGDHDHSGDPHQADEAPNPHVWLDPRLAARQVRTIRDALVAADPARAGCFRRNAGRYLAELERLDRDLAGQLAPHAGRPIVSFHDLAPYFAQRYGLRAESVVALPGDNPSVADLQRVATQLRRQRVRALLVDPQVEASSFRALAADLDLQVLAFDPIERASEADARRPGHYLEAMRRNGAAVLASLRAPAR